MWSLMAGGRLVHVVASPSLTVHVYYSKSLRTQVPVC